MSPRRTDDALAWLDQGPSLADLREAYPQEWETVRATLDRAVAAGDPRAFQAEIARSTRDPASASRSDRRKLGHTETVAAQVRHQMTTAAVRQMCIAAATGVTDGRVRFNLVNGWIAQRLLFSSALVRKPVSLRWFRVVWPLLWQRSFLMPLVEPKGIYCFYSKPLIARLKDLIDGRPCLEIAAGDGTLSRFLRDAGVDVTATDDHSWKAVPPTDTVLRQDAREALRVHQPEVVIASWPPAGNGFERSVFQTASVKLYVVIASQHDFAAGNWAAYREQTRFTFAEDPALSRLVLPPELEPAVYVFRRHA